MNSLSQLSHLLADEKIPAAEVLATFTHLGFIAGTKDIEHGLEIATMLNSRFRNLAIALPTANTALQRFINCERILQNLNTKKAASAALIQIDGSAHTTRTSRNIKTDYCELILSEHVFQSIPNRASVVFNSSRKLLRCKVCGWHANLSYRVIMKMINRGDYLSLDDLYYHQKIDLQII